MLTVRQVQAKVRHIKQIAIVEKDDEKAHGEEDRLQTEVLQAIADGECEDPRGCALAALSTSLIKFRRWGG
jgi:hypothetical protein